jgi:predicted aspartyl protease
MRTTARQGAKAMGKFSVEFQVVNNGDLEMVHRGLMPPDKVRRQTIAGVVDPGAAMLVLPQSVVKRLGLRLKGKTRVRYADHRSNERWEAEGAHVELLGRSDTFSAVVEPKRNTALIGAIVLEALDLLVDCRRQRLVPRDARGPVFEIE